MKPIPGTRINLSAISSVVLILWICTGCSTFHRDWKQAAGLPGTPGDLLGRWEGTWVSEDNGHQGRLRCLVTKTGADRYQARFHANYRKILSFGYTVPLRVQVLPSGMDYRFRGEANLGWYAGGLYRYEGGATPSTFNATYRTSTDYGTFRMSRPAPAP